MSLTRLLRTADLEQTRGFYESVLGFEAFDTAEGTLTVEKQGGKLIFTEAFGPPDGFSGTLYFAVPDVDGYFAAIRASVNVIWPVQDMSYGSREFGITDCNGYHLAFQQQV